MAIVYCSSCGQDRWFAAQPSLEIPSVDRIVHKMQKNSKFQIRSMHFFHLSIPRQTVTATILPAFATSRIQFKWSLLSALIKMSWRFIECTMHIYKIHYTPYILYTPIFTLYPFAWERYIHRSLRPDTFFILICLQ